MGKKSALEFPVIHPHAAGIDIGSRSHWVCTGPGKEQTREFGVFTEDLHEMCRWLRQEGVRQVVMESTGPYWKQPFLMLQSYGMEPTLVNARFVHNVSGKKTDVKDCQWLWQLHSVGLLHGSFQPDGFTDELRTYVRHRKNLVEDASRYLTKMQKALTLMNVHLSVVLSDLAGKSGQAIVKAILEGERDGGRLAALADPRVKATREALAKALTGFWQDCHLFELRQCRDTYRHLWGQVTACDAQIEALLERKVESTGQAELVYGPVKKKKRQKNDPAFDPARYAYQLTDGVDLSAIEGFGDGTILTALSETGLTDLGAKFPSAKHFVSWLCLCPNNKKTGGKVFSSRTRCNTGRLAQAFRAAANAVGNQKDSALADFFRRLAAKRGRKLAITATARKLATILYNMVAKRQPYSPDTAEEYRSKMRNQKIRIIQRTMKQFGITDKDILAAA